MPPAVPEVRTGRRGVSIQEIGWAASVDGKPGEREGVSELR